MSTLDLFTEAESDVEVIARGAFLLRGFVADTDATLLAEIVRISKVAPFRHMVTPAGYRMSAAMTNCGPAGWTTDCNGYRYECVDPTTGNAWPPLPGLFSNTATRAAKKVGYKHFAPDACLINRYAPGARLSLHQDRDEADLTAPIVSVSLGLSAIFLFGGPHRTDRPQRISLQHGDVIVWGGPARLFYHGIAPLKDDFHPLTGRIRYNLTLRKAL